MPEKSSGKSKGYENLRPFPKGVSGNPKGKRVGQRDYATIYREALIKLGTMNNISPDELEVDILLKGLASARKGDYKFYKDTLDRLHGSPKQSVDLTSGGKELPTPIMQLNTGKMNGVIPANNGDTEDSKPE